MPPRLPTRLRLAQLLTGLMFFAAGLLVVFGDLDGTQRAFGLATAAAGALGGLLVQLLIFAWEREHKPGSFADDE